MDRWFFVAWLAGIVTTLVGANLYGLIRTDYRVWRYRRHQARTVRAYLDPIEGRPRTFPGPAPSHTATTGDLLRQREG